MHGAAGALGGGSFSPIKIIIVWVTPQALRALPETSSRLQPQGWGGSEAFFFEGTECNHLGCGNWDNYVLPHLIVTCSFTRGSFFSSSARRLGRGNHRRALSGGKLPAPECPAAAEGTTTPGVPRGGGGLQLPACPAVAGDYNSRRAPRGSPCRSGGRRQPWLRGSRRARAAARPATRPGLCPGGRSRFPAALSAPSLRRRPCPRWGGGVRPLTRRPSALPGPPVAAGAAALPASSHRWVPARGGGAGGGPCSVAPTGSDLCLPPAWGRGLLRRRAVARPGRAGRVSPGGWGWSLPE